MHHTALLLCFVVGYGLALALELLHVRLGRPGLRLAALTCGLAALAAHTAYIYLYAGQMPLENQRRWMLYLAWILAVFYLCGEFRQRRLPWGAFVLPVVLGLLQQTGEIRRVPTNGRLDQQNYRYELWWLPEWKGSVEQAYTELARRHFQTELFQHIQAHQAQVADILLHQVGYVVVAHEQHVQRQVLAETDELVLAARQLQAAASEQIQ